MGYDTDFYGYFTLEPHLNNAQINYLKKFSENGRMKRNAEIVETFPDPERLAVGLPVGQDGEYFTGGSGFYGQDHDESVINGNSPPATQPGLWCQWVPSDDGSMIKWDNGEKFYDYVEWLEYIVEHFLKPWGIVMNGSVEWRGEDTEDTGIIHVHDNIVSTSIGHVVYG